MGAIHCDAWRDGCQGEPLQRGPDAASAPPVGSMGRPAVTAPHPRGAHSPLAVNAGPSSLAGASPAVALALVTLFPDLTPAALQHMLGLG
jgi:hypothetical protein